MSKRVARSRPKHFELDISASSGAKHVAYLDKMVPQARASMRSKVNRLSIALVGDATMSRLHKQFMNIAGPTDVLTFELEHDAKGHVIEGEVVLCVPEAIRQAKKHSKGVANELLLYAIHGLLHLSGYDDLTEADHRTMHREEDRILTALKIGPVFESEGEAKMKLKKTKKDGRTR